MGRESNISKALSQLEHQSCVCRSNEYEAYKEELFDSIARRIMEGKLTKAQIRYWAERRDEYKILTAPLK